jgi:hypothetical protein
MVTAIVTAGEGGARRDFSFATANRPAESGLWLRETIWKCHAKGKEATSVAQIVETEYFQQLQRQARELRESFQKTGE